jgi:phospholipase/carboxylesterase
LESFVFDEPRGVNDQADMDSDYLDCVEINPPGRAKAAVIWLHGLGADGHDFEPIAAELGLPADLAVRFVFPHAPQRAVTVNFGMVMRAWYDILDMDVGRRVDTGSIHQSAEHLKKLIQRETGSGMPSESIVVAGFSQGGAIALHAGLRYPDRLAGILALSTYLPTARSLEREASDANRGIPIMMAHGKFDPIIPIGNGISARKALTELDYPVEWHEYPMQHEVCMDEIDAIRTWLLKVWACSANRENSTDERRPPNGNETHQSHSAKNR